MLIIVFFYYRKHVNQFEILRDWYSKSINRDPNYTVYLDNIGRIWFGIEVPRISRTSNSMFSGLLKSIIGNEDSTDEEGEIMSSATAPDLD